MLQKDVTAIVAAITTTNAKILPSFRNSTPITVIDLYRIVFPSPMLGSQGKINPPV